MSHNRDDQLGHRVGSRDTGQEDLTNLSTDQEEKDAAILKQEDEEPKVSMGKEK